MVIAVTGANAGALHYELAMEVYRAVKSGGAAEIEREMAWLERFSELRFHGSFMEEFGFGGKDIHILAVEFPRMLQHLLGRMLEEKKPRPSRRGRRSEPDAE